MIDKEFALGTWEIHLQTKEEKEYILSKMKPICKYVDTAIDYNNDYILADIPKEYKVISKISSYHGKDYDFFVDNHFKCLKRDKIDIMLIHSSRGDWKSVAKRMVHDDRFIETGVSNFNKAEIEEYKNLVGRYPTYNEIEINPFYTDVDTINFCKEHGIKIISYGIFGGKYRAMTYIADYSIPYLILYAASFADIIILKPESYRQTNEILDVVENYVDDGENKISLNKVLDNKSVEPMRYFAKDIIKRFNGFETYTNWCGKNRSDKPLLGSPALNEIPNFEMLGDYQTYIRYKFRQNYDGSPVYDYDFLIGDDGNYYVVYLYDEVGRISKINKFNKVQILKLAPIKL